MLPTTRRPLHILAPLAFTALGAGLALLAAGPLNPPAGTVSPSYKTLAEVEPRIAINATNTPGDADSLFKITAPGSYYLTGNLTGVAGKHGIEIASRGVTIDLNGFTLAGVPGMGDFDGVVVTQADIDTVTLRNGLIRGWGATGVNFYTYLVPQCHVSNLTAEGNASNGIMVGPGSIVVGCTSRSNGATGFFSREGCTITGCSSTENGGGGILAGSSCTLIGCTAAWNDNSGLSVGEASVVSSCSSSRNAGLGISGSAACTVTGCTSRDNAGDGILVTSNCLVSGNTVSRSGLNGIDLASGIHATGADNRIEGNNVTAGTGIGIDVDAAGNIIVRNTASGNAINWSIVANNIVGPVLDRTAPASAAINGNSAPDSTGSTHPHANFTY